MGLRKARYFMGDFETTVFKGQAYTEVWAAACVELYNDDVKIFHSIGEQFEYLKSLNENIVIYYHNLKFDGAFWLSFLLVDLHYETAAENSETDINDFVFLENSQMPNNSVTYSISNMGQWYRITIKTGGKIIEIRDSLKLLPFSVRRIGESFGTKHKKLEMEYTGVRYAGCPITEEEQLYIANDVLVVKEALEIMFDNGNKKLTIGSCCLNEYKSIMGKALYAEYFPNVYDIPLDETEHKYKNVGEWIKRSYRGGWCYLARGKAGKIFTNGTTADVNSLYPSMMSSESGNRYPVGNPIFWKGNYIPQQALQEDSYFFVRIKTRFYLKPGKLPFIQIKGNLLYLGNKCLETSDIYNPKDGKYYDRHIDLDGNERPADVELTLTQTDYFLILEHYNLVDCEILDGCYFQSEIGIFDEYIEHYKQQKLTTKGAKRELAKLFLNNLYGKMASSTNSSFKVAYVKPDKTLGFYTVFANDKQPGYIPVGSAITSYARNFTIRAAQKNYHGPNTPGFIYADTDSIHCDLPPNEIQGISVHDKNFCCWKLESCWDIGLFVRQKTYIEHITKENLQLISDSYYNVKCAGMPERCKDLFIKSVEGYEIPDEDQENYTEQEKLFLQEKRELTDFDIGLIVPGKLLPKRIPGGVLLVDTTYEMR